MSHSILLRASGNELGEVFDVQGVLTGAAAITGVPNAATLIELGESVLGVDARRLVDAQNNAYQTLGAAAFVDAAAIVASFNAVVKIADATGIPLEENKQKILNEWNREGTFGCPSVTSPFP